ncbi:MAG: cytochrome b N-terminal domain-containing protein [Phycisphaerae bacterium]|nr:cytochrome b N-terminal domain-containing protein [Phycisphaerae bacterium]NUQ47070.1 cytochrome b N-terminal domain-containing protein [Phycisphaerae bacterium]
MRVIRNVTEALDERYKLTPLIEKNVTKKLVPRTLSWAACFGGLSLLVFLIQVFSGMLLLMYYKPDPARAWDSVTYIKSNVPMGWLIQRVHAVGANVMIVLVLMHFARVLYFKIYRAPRELHWVSGVVLLVLTTLMAFTGYLLPWTQLSYWGAKVGTEIPGAVPGIGPAIVEWLRRGNVISGETLGFFYAMHIWILPGLMSGFMVMHFLMIRRTGISRPL